MTEQLDTAAASSRYASRKFLLACCMLIGAAAALGTGRIAPEIWADVSKWTLGLYFAANVGSWLSDALARLAAPK